MKIRLYSIMIIVSLACLLPGSRELSAWENGKQEESAITADLFDKLKWRNLGPANMSGRVADIEGIPGNPNIVYVGSASGGVWKTANGGVTWEPIFDDQPVASIGDMALEPGNPDVIYVGTGESNVRNSVSFGNGVYRSTDGGNSWSHLGLEETRYISRIVIDPKNPAVVYVGALGHIYGPNDERGVYRSEDRGESWSRVCFLDNHHGVADMDINPENPNILYAAFWHFERKPWTFTSGDEKGGVFRSVDGGRSWKKLTEGLPKLMGRIGVKVSPSNPDVVYVIAESNEGTLFRSEDKGDHFRQMSERRDIVSRGFYYADVRIDPRDANVVYAAASRLFVSLNAGKDFERISDSTHVDFHSLWIDPENPQRMWQGQDGGIAVSTDRGKTWDNVNNFPLGQFYQIYADNRLPFYYTGGGLQDNGTWFGPSRTREPFGIMNDDWRMISFGDGFYIVAHPEDPELFLTESQGGSIVRTDMRTREQQSVSPQPYGAGGGPASLLPYRFHWNAPIIPCPHDDNTVYFAANVVFKSTDFGMSWEKISGDLTTDDPGKQMTAGGPVWTENTTAEYHCTIISLAESPVQPGVLWAGTDDGNLNVTMDGGGVWRNVVGAVPGIPDRSPVSHVEPSRSSAGMAYCAFDRHGWDDFKPYIYLTTDFGRSWTDITGNLPEEGYIWVVREDPRNPNVIYVGTELGLYVSLTRGEEWFPLHMENLPSVAVHDILVHPRDNDLILGTHGRGIWIFDNISALQELSEENLADSAYLFTFRPAFRHSMLATRYGIGNKLFQAPNPPYGALITYYLDQTSDDADIKIEVLDSNREIIRTIRDIPRERGLNRTAWDLRVEGPRKRKTDEPEERSAGRGPQVLPDAYSIRLTVDGKTFEKPLQVQMDPTVDVSREDLVEKYETETVLTEMISIGNDALRALDSVKSQLEERRKSLQNMRDEVSVESLNVIDEYLEKIQDLLSRLVRSSDPLNRDRGARLMDKLRSFFGSIDEGNAVPTKAQKTYYGELRNGFSEEMDVVNTFLADSLPELNEALELSGVPVLLIPGLIDTAIR